MKFRSILRDGGLAALLAVVATSAAMLPTGSAEATTTSGAPTSWVVPAGDGVSADNVTGHGSVVGLADTSRHPALTRSGGYGSEVLATHDVSRPVRTVTATADASVPPGSAVLVEVRGRRSDGRWTTWSRSAGGPVDLGGDVTSVQGRLTLSSAGAASPQVRAVRFATGGSAAAATPKAVTPQAAESFTVYATREGLVGGTTSNGHVITSEDHFVALPSTSALSSNGGHEYEVRVCNAATCLTEPVWDVGPWNTHDAYWANPRTDYADLPVGVPEAAAAYNDGYNGGVDGFGRHPSNPARIDLADGVFHDLGLTDNGNVQVTYLWTDTGAPR